MILYSGKYFTCSRFWSVTNLKCIPISSNQTEVTYIHFGWLTMQFITEIQNYWDNSNLGFQYILVCYYTI